VPASDLISTGVRPGEMGFAFGGNGFFGCGFPTSEATESTLASYQNVQPGQEGLWWSTYEIYPCPDYRNFDPEDAKRQFIARHSTWKHPTVKKVLENVDIRVMW